MPPDDLGPGPDAGEVKDGPADTVIKITLDALPTAICCQITSDITDDPNWQNGEYMCGDPRSVPWVCNNNTKPTSCDDPACVPGHSTCQGFNGYGEVVFCK